MPEIKTENGSNIDKQNKSNIKNYKAESKKIRK